MSSSNQPSLVALNSNTLGAKFPEITLPDGTKVQTGTVGALLMNVKKYDTLHASLSNIPPTKPADKQNVKAELAALDEAFRMTLPLLFKVGMFDLFGVHEWVAGTSPGRKRVGELAGEFVAEREKEKGNGEGSG